MRIAGVILAGGRATRMGGGDKCMKQVAGKPLLAHVVARLGPQVERLAINANGDPARFDRFGLPVLADTVPGFAGPLAGVLAGMRWAEGEGFTHLASAAGDTPFFPTDLVACLADALSPTEQIAMAATREPERGLSEHPTFALWPVRLADDLEDALTRGQLRKVIVWAARHGIVRVIFDATPYPFFNVNSPEDLETAERIAAGEGAA